MGGLTMPKTAAQLNRFWGYADELCYRLRWSASRPLMRNWTTGSTGGPQPAHTSRRAPVTSD